MAQQTQPLTDRYHLDVYNRYPVTLVRGEGTRVWDDQGKEYLDALAGIAVNALGHCPPKVVAAIREQTGRLMHTSNLFYNEPQSKLAEALCQASGMDRVFFCNTGAEAMEGSLKLARYAARQRGKTGKIIVLEHGFHGRTLATISMGKPTYYEGFEPLLPGIEQIPFNDVEALEAAFDEETIGVLFEPIQGSGGLHVVSEAFFKRSAELCDQHNALLIMDEVQSGVGRTGHFYAYQQFGVEPDIVATAKALGSGFPIGAFLTKEDVASALPRGKHGTTYGGNPVACAAGLASVSEINQSDFLQSVRSKGEYLKEQLLALQQKFSEQITDVRGRGLMMGVELADPGREIAERMLESGVIVNCTAGNVIRMVPPLIITEAELDQVVNALDQALGEHTS
jgi:acetylornithine/N-succinyldiaminopimelate aminotransferase